MRGPEAVQRKPFQIGETGKRNSGQGQQPARQHSNGCAAHRHPAPPCAHEEQREITRRGNRKRLPDHEIDLEWLDLHPQDDRDPADHNRTDLKRPHSLIRGCARAKHPSIDIVRQGARHRD